MEEVCRLAEPDDMQLAMHKKGPGWRSLEGLGDLRKVQQGAKACKDEQAALSEAVDTKPKDWRLEMRAVAYANMLMEEDPTFKCPP
jgi:hypothetical protein